MAKTENSFYNCYKYGISEYELVGIRKHSHNPTSVENSLIVIYCTSHMYLKKIHVFEFYNKKRLYLQWVLQNWLHVYIPEIGWMVSYIGCRFQYYNVIILFYVFILPEYMTFKLLSYWYTVILFPFNCFCRILYRSSHCIILLCNKVFLRTRACTILFTSTFWKIK